MKNVQCPTITITLPNGETYILEPRPTSPNSVLNAQNDVDIDPDEMLYDHTLYGYGNIVSDEIFPVLGDSPPPSEA